MKALIIGLALLLTGCASMDAAHIEGVKQDAAKYQEYSRIELQKQAAVRACFNVAHTDNQVAMCAMMGVATGVASTFGGRPTPITIAPTSGQLIQGTVSAVAPYAAAAAIAKSVAEVQAKDPIVTPTQVVRPEIVRPEIITIP
jgi:phage shock protein PspC (stress-responsive transcriptional regulator)